MLKWLFQSRYEIFLSTQLLILFGTLFFPKTLYLTTILPILFLTNIAMGIILTIKKRILFWFLILNFGIATLNFVYGLFVGPNEITMKSRLMIFFVFYFLVTIEIIRQINHSDFLDRNVIIGLMSGYISLGFLGYFLFMLIEVTVPGSLQGLVVDENTLKVPPDQVMYFSFITMLTVGYGHIFPVGVFAQKAAILLGLTGQFYLVIITTLVIEKYLKLSSK